MQDPDDRSVEFGHLHDMGRIFQHVALRKLMELYRCVSGQQKAEKI